MSTNDDAARQVTLHPQARQAAEPYRLRPFRRIRNLVEHLDTAYRLMDAIDAERVAAKKAHQNAVALIQQMNDQNTAQQSWSHSSLLQERIDREIA